MLCDELAAGPRKVQAGGFLFLKHGLSRYVNQIEVCAISIIESFEPFSYGKRKYIKVSGDRFHFKRVLYVEKSHLFGLIS